jgi:hypothetical protein
MERLELGCDGDGERGEKEEANLVYWIVRNKVGPPVRPVQFIPVYQTKVGQPVHWSKWSIPIKQVGTASYITFFLINFFNYKKLNIFLLFF